MLILTFKKKILVQTEVTGMLDPVATTCAIDKVQARSDKIHKLAPKASCNVSFIYSTVATTEVKHKRHNQSGLYF